MTTYVSKITGLVYIFLVINKQQFTPRECYYIGLEAAVDGVLRNSDDDESDFAIIPPDPSTLTDEEEGAEEDIAGCFMPHDVPHTIEVFTNPEDGSVKFDLSKSANLTDRHVDPECEYQASILCEEDPSTRASAIEKLRNMIHERGECHPPRMDDAFLLRFLRVRRSIPARAHRLIVRYCNFREQNKHLWIDVSWYGLRKLGNVFEGVLFDRPDVGRLIICRIGQWDPDFIPAEDLVRGCLIFLEIGIMQPKLQVLGGTAMLDCEDITLKHMRQLTPSVVMQIINVTGFPIHQRGMHIINCSRLFEKLFYVFKRFAPNDGLWEKVHFHGYDLNSLHRYIDPECLPTRYGGPREPVSLREWLTKIRQYKNKKFDEDMRSLGYAVD
ncbi:alpha-tocopherol transfer protein-like [Bicyclus anynana]|uniref:Alpha-tocopherol transfer protein-like n=1 Tax=Bicyclus anynana TaxID=110368 RepID=A0ABM3LU91_BICAN|nr:alpha-tocopherol transfer protein-like [Bicyclus anynana]